MTAYFIVRAQVMDAAVKKDFDRWYQEEHLPDALKAFNAKRAWRGWSQMDPLVHHAFYEFADLAGVRAIQGSDGHKNLVAEFDRVWGNKVTRSRDIVETVQSIGP
ncbi:MAG: hypothetical protein EXR36_08535 [Betaproteobacteria bacterium]|nr:hypothetical protein [Betaproteobacteria bacterium]